MQMVFEKWDRKTCGIIQVMPIRNKNSCLGAAWTLIIRRRRILQGAFVKI